MNIAVLKSNDIKIDKNISDAGLNRYAENRWVKNNAGHELPTCDVKYLKWNDPEAFDWVLEMTAEEKAIKNAVLLEQAKESRIDLFNGFAESDILSVYPLYKQCNMANGIYTPEEVVVMKTFIQNVRTKFYAKSDEINACTTESAVGAIDWTD